MSLIVWIILSCMAYRIARFIVLDTLIEGTRDKVHAWLGDHPSMLSLKAQELIGCPYCVTIWTAAGSVVFWDLAVADWSGWAFVAHWLAAATGALIIWHIVDAED